MEGIVGDLPSMENDNNPSALVREDGSFLVDGGLDRDVFTELIEQDIFGLEHDVRYHTLAGFVMHVLERVPREADHFDWQGYRFEVIDMDGKRIDKLLVAPVPVDQAKGGPVEDR
jgi:putative hemolysin